MPYNKKNIALPLVALATSFIMWASGTWAQTNTAAASPAAADLAGVRPLIEEAIRLGVPLYNGGQPAACAAVYRITLRSLLLLAPDDSDQQLIARALRTASSQDPERSAWTLRYALDAMYTKSERGSAVNDTDFSIGFAADNSAPWYVVNDDVMGGVSRGNLTRTKNETGEFSGQLSLRNNGGFSSVRTRVQDAALTGYDGVEMRVRGDGRVYALLAASANARGSWQKKFATSADWQTIRIPFNTMEMSIRGWRPAQYPPITGQSIDELGLLIADKDVRPFRLEVDWIRGYTDELSDAQNDTDRK